MKIKIVGFLQNPWSPYYAGGTWPRTSWLEALWQSRSGQRLKLMLCDEIDFWFDNSTPIVCANPNDILPADLGHMRKVINDQQPKYILTFGVPASTAMTALRNEFKHPWMALPHPAYRLVTNRLFNEALGYLKNGFDGYMKFMPARGGEVNISINQP